MASSYEVRRVGWSRAEKWGKAVGEGFSARPGDPARFYNKLVAEGSGDMHPILLAAVFRETAEYAGTARVFRRWIRVDPFGYVPISGIGEVSTLHRGKGLAK